ncbi:MAG: four helix bundle protein [Blastochloris sp.]|nr:four helix bundle protein [Blastochloris sp.]
MSTITSFRDFDAYQEARVLVKNLYALTRRKPISSDYALCDQMRRAAISITSNFAEGFEREGKQEFIQFISYAKGSTGEIMAQLDIALDQDYLSAEQHQELDQAADKVRKMLAGLSNYLRKTEHAGLKFKRTENRKLKTENPDRKSSGFAIISTLLVLTVLTIMVVAFLQSMRIERLTARSYLNKTKADLLARAAAQKAISQISQNMRDPLTGKVDLSYTVESSHPNTTTITTPNYLAYSPVIFLSRYEMDSGGILRRRATPLISTIQPDSDFKKDLPSDFNVALKNLFEERKDTKKTADLNLRENIQALSTLTTPTPNLYYRIPLLDITDPENEFKGKFGYLVLDEQSRLNPSFHRSAPREQYAQTAMEMALGTGGSVLLNPVELAAFLSAPILPSSPWAMGQYFSTADRAKARRHLFGYYNVPNLDVIPAGLTDAGKPKYNINELATNTLYGSTATLRAENIATLINNNLPNFKLRDPSLTSETAANQQRYLNRLAASIVDYIDTDSSITTVNGGEPAGRDLFPLVTTLAEHYSCGSETGSGPYSTTVQSRIYVQLWNPYTSSVTGSARIIVKNRMRVRYGTGIVTPFANYNPSAINNITLRPNEFVVVAFSFCLSDIHQSYWTQYYNNSSTQLAFILCRNCRPINMGAL